VIKVIECPLCVHQLLNPAANEVFHLLASLAQLAMAHYPSVRAVMKVKLLLTKLLTQMCLNDYEHVQMESKKHTL
jgi:hypothetical protein